MEMASCSDVPVHYRIIFDSQCGQKICKFLRESILKERAEYLLTNSLIHFSLSLFSGLLVSVTLPCYHQGKFIGVTGTDINIEDLMPDVLEYFKQGRTTYAFMITTSGRTLIHPLLPAPADAYGDPIYMDIRNLEQPESEFKAIFDSMARYVPRCESVT